MNIARRIVLVLLTLGIAGPVFGQVDTANAQKKLLSKRAAEADAYRKLAECIKGLRITSDTYVKDFVAESDTIAAAMDEFIRGVRLGQPKWFDDMSCEVPAEVTVEKVITTLKEIHKRQYHGNRVSGEDLSQMNQKIDTKIIKVVGQGAPREDLPPGLPQGVEQQLGGPPPSPKPALPPLWSKIRAGDRLMAERAAEVDGKRQLLERIKGLRITSDTLVRDFVAESDQITAQAMGHLIGATKVRTYFHHDEPIVEVTVEVPLESVVTVIKELQTRTIQGDKVKGLDVSEVTKSIKTQTFQATGMGIPPQRAIEQINAQAPADAQIPPWASTRIEMTGSGVAPADKAGTPQGKLLAARAGELDAKRKLAEKINGLVISSNTTVKDFVAQHDEINTQVAAILVGSQVEKTVFDGETANVTVSIPGMEIWQTIHATIRTTTR